MLELPRIAGRMLARRGHVLVIFAALGAIAHELLLQRAAKLADGHPVLSLLTVAVGVLVTVLVYTLMFALLRRQIESREAVRAGQTSVSRLHLNQDGVLGSIFAVALPFLVFYGAWGFFAQDMSALVREATVGLGHESPLRMSVRTPAGGAVACFLLRALFDQLWRRWRFGPWALAAAAFEAGWLVFAFAIALHHVSDVRHWVTTRRVYVGTDAVLQHVADWLYAVTGYIAPLAHAVADVFSSLWVVLDPLKYALVEPALWLTIAAIAAGLELERLHLRASWAARIPRAAAPLRVFAEELHEKYVPLFNGARIVAAAGAVPFLICAVWYGAVVAGGSHVDRALYALPRLGEPDALSELYIDGLRDAWGVLLTALRIVVLAAGLELLLSRVIVRTEGTAAAPPAPIRSA